MITRGGWPSAGEELGDPAVCEVLSPATSRLDRGPKLRIYAREAVAFTWLVDPRDRTLEVLERQGDRWVLRAHHGGEERVRARPFDSIELDPVGAGGPGR